MSQPWTEGDLRFMRRAIALSKKGFPAPNPHVGCVIVKDNEVIGEGWHEYAGAPHAEIAALQDAGLWAKGADVYVTLEPCNHQGRTGPCSLALLEAGVRRVVYACDDPNPRAQGGASVLRSHGVEVESGLLEHEAAEANTQFLFAMRHERPFVVAKAAFSLDGRIALASGESKWITGELARREAHRLRAELGCVLVGRRTVEIDNPQLTARVAGVHNQPLRVVLDPKKALTGREDVFNDDAESLWINGDIELQELLRSLYARGITGVLVEGGGTTIAHFVREGLVDRYELFIAPKLLGEGPSWIGGLQVVELQHAPALQIIHTRKLGDDLWITAQPAPAEQSAPATE
jgi:diaminohydroxyphosphoribosylaminopyrimidine deaminase / 5-amino-6-(5-phosphoribosylamino)uracil reductase